MVDDAQERADVLEKLAVLTDNFEMLYEFAWGQRAELERRGWSPTVAEAMAATILNSLIMNIFSGHA